MKNQPKKPDINAFFFFFFLMVRFRSPEELFHEYDSTGVVFKPAVPVPKKVTTVKLTGFNYLMMKRYEEYLDSIFQISTDVEKIPLEYCKAINLKRLKSI